MCFYNAQSCEDGLVQEYHVEFYPIPKAYIKPLDMDGGKQETDARRHSTPSYALGSFKEASFKTQWRWMWMDDRHNLKLFDTVCEFQVIRGQPFVSFYSGLTDKS